MCQTISATDGKKSREQLIQELSEVRNQLAVERKQAEQALRKSERLLKELNETLERQVAERTEMAQTRAKQLQALAMELIDTEERDRRQFAHLLHDDLQQMLSAARMQLQAVSDKLPNERMLKTVGRTLEDSIAKTRWLSHELSSDVLHHSGLVTGLQWLASQMNIQFGLSVQLKVNASLEVKSPVLKLFLFRAVQELLFNIIKHAGVKKAHVLFSRSDQDILISVSDHGKGFASEDLNQSKRKTGYGLRSIGERANYFGGSLTIDSTPGNGSRFNLSVPLSAASTVEKIDLSVARHGSSSEEPLVPTSADGIRVLLVDDHHVMRQGLIKLITGQTGYSGGGRGRQWGGSP